MLAVALGRATVEAGYRTHYTIAADLAARCHRAAIEGRWATTMRFYAGPRLLIIDEVGYLPLAAEAAAALFQVITQRYLRGSVILTTNLGIASWGRIFDDPTVVAAMLDRLLHRSVVFNIDGNSYRMPAAQEHILGHDDGKDRLLQAVGDLSRAFALAVPADRAIAVRDEVGFYQAVRAVLAKSASGERKTDYELDHAIRQIISGAVASDEVMDIFAAAGLKKPDISILSDEFLAEVKGMLQRNLAVELLQRLLVGEIRSRSRRNVVQARSFADLLEQALRRYQNRAIETAQVIEELIALAKAMRDANARGVELGLTEDELAFYDALGTNDSAVKVLGEPTLTMIASELVATVKKNVTIDWTIRENARAQLRVVVKRILRKYGYPPDKQEHATQTVLEQAEVLSEGWALAYAA